MGYDVNNMFSGVSTVDRFENSDEKVECLQTQVTSLKRDLEYLLYNIDTGNFSKRLQNVIASLEQGGSDG